MIEENEIRPDGTPEAGTAPASPNTHTSGENVFSGVHPTYTNVPPRMNGAYPPPPMAGRGIPYGYMPPQTENKTKKKKVWPWVLGIVLGIFFLFALALLSFAIRAAETGENSRGTADFPSHEYVAVLYIDGEIAGDYVTTLRYGALGTYDQVYLMDTLDTLMEDKNNVGLMLYINSPGGEVIATMELSDKIDEYKSVTHRPVYAYFGDYAASGAYWLGCRADTIVAHPICVNGSIGVTYGTHLDYSGLLEKLGITATELVSGDNKAMGSEFSPLTEEQKQIYAAQIEEIYEMFVSEVSRCRHLSEADVKKIADGRTFLTRQAIEYGLVDLSGVFDDALDVMWTNEGFGDYVTAVDCYAYGYTGFDLLSYLGEAKTGETEEQAILNGLRAAAEKKRGFYALYVG